MRAQRFSPAHFRSLVALLAGATWLLAAPAVAAEHTEGAKPRHVTVTASGSVRAVPNIAFISTGVETTGKTAQDALDENSRAMRRVIARLKDNGIRPGNITTSNLSVNPRYERLQPNQNTAPRIIGYSVVNNVRIRVTDISILGDVIDQVTRTGANRIGGISFQVRRSEQRRDEARTRAVENARRRAELYARAAGARLGEVLMIREGAPSFSRGPVMMEARSARSVPISRGEQELSVTITVRYALR
ncbi:MAG: SIMPL domain-containing protein [Pseudomonadota bacterium]